MRSSRRMPPKVEPRPGAVTLPHVRPITPLLFRDQEPPEEQLVESPRHLDVCRALVEALRTVVSLAKDSVGADQFVYFRANDPRQCLAPDAFVRLGSPDEDFASWKAWERGAPDVAFELLSPADSVEAWTLEEKIDRYNELGVRELVVFELDAAEGQRLRVWDRLDGDFVERVVAGERTSCVTLDCDLVVGPVALEGGASHPVGLRLVQFGVVIPTVEEARSAAEQVAYAAEVTRRQAEALQEADAQARSAEAQSQRAEALARGEQRAAEIEAAAARTRGSR